MRERVNLLSNGQAVSYGWPLFGQTKRAHRTSDDKEEVATLVQAVDTAKLVPVKTLVIERFEHKNGASYRQAVEEKKQLIADYIVEAGAAIKEDQIRAAYAEDLVAESPDPQYEEHFATF